MKILITLIMLAVSVNAYSLDPKKCFKVVHGDGLLYNYEFPGYSSAEYLTKKHGTTFGMLQNSMQSSLALVDPSVTTGRFTSTSQLSSSSAGGCNYFSKAKVERMEYIARNRDALMEQIAMGRGEHLRSLYYLNLCADGKLAAFRRMLQTHFLSLEKFQKSELIDGEIEGLLQTQPEMIGVCHLG